MIFSIFSLSTEYIFFNLFLGWVKIKGQMLGGLKESGV